MQTVLPSAEVTVPILTGGSKLNSIVAQINSCVSQMDDLAGEAAEPMAKLLYSWGASKYRSYSDRFKAARSRRERNRVMSEMRNLGEALSLAASSLGNPLASSELAKIIEGANAAELSALSQEALRADLSLFLVRHVQEITHGTEVDLASWRPSPDTYSTREQVRVVCRWHAEQVLDLLQLLPHSDVALAANEIGRVIAMIQKNTVEQLLSLTCDVATAREN
ncbi:MAG: hypothetical protein ACR2PG_02965 [Hyphomicrobiaceae bacterium]